MEKEWVAANAESYKDNLKRKLSQIMEQWNAITYEKTNVIMSNIDLRMQLISTQAHFGKEITYEDVQSLIATINSGDNVQYPELTQLKSLCEDYAEALLTGDCDQLSDSETMEFDGDLVIIDPYAFLLPEHVAKGFSTLSELGIRGLQHKTLAHNWECYVYHLKTQQAIARFDSIKDWVCVTTLQEIQRVNPMFTNQHKHGAIIYNFRGNVQIKVDVNGDETECYIDGTGINTHTEQEVCFTTCQTN